MLQDKLTVATLMALELKAWPATDQRLEERLALDEWQSRDVSAIEVQEIEGVIDEPHFAPTIGRRLRLGEAWQSTIIEAAEFAVEIGGLRLHVRKRFDDAWLFACPVEPGPGSGAAHGVPDARRPKSHCRMVIWR